MGDQTPNAIMMIDDNDQCEFVVGLGFYRRQASTNVNHNCNARSPSLSLSRPARREPTGGSSCAKLIINQHASMMMMMYDPASVGEFN
jgi:hypothetical protein